MADEKTKEELLEEARRLGIEGRHAMSKAELEAAIGEAESSGEVDYDEGGEGELGVRTTVGGVTSVTLNPDEQRPATGGQVFGADVIEDSGDLEYTPEAMKGVSQDRWFKPASHHAYPVETEWEVAQREAYQAEIDEHNAAREAEQAEREEAAEARARKRLNDLLGK